MPDLSKLPKPFDQDDIEASVERCKVLPEGWNWDRFVAWLAIPANQQQIINVHGADYTLRQALDMLNAPVLSNTMRARLGMRTLRKKRKLADSFPETALRSTQNIPGEGMTDDSESVSLPTISENEIEAKLAELLAGQTDVQAQDLSLARRFVQAELLSQKYYELLTSGKNVPTALISALNLAIEKQSRIAGDCLKLLGIDRAKRQAEADKRSDVEQVLAVIEEAGKFALASCIQIVHCNTLIGWVIPEFREVGFTITGTCPKCREAYSIVHVPSEEDLRFTTEPDWVAAEESSYSLGKEEEEESDEGKLPGE